MARARTRILFLPRKTLDYGYENAVAVTGDVPAAGLYRLKKVPAFDSDSHKFTKIGDCLQKGNRFEALKKAMTSIGISGMTVSHVLGYGMQQGKPEYYRGVPMEANLLPKIQVDIVVSQVPVRTVIETAKKSPLHRPYRRWQDFCLRC